MNELFLLGRLILGGTLLYNGSHHFTQLGAYMDMAAAKGVPFPMAAVLFAGVLLLLAGVTFVLGIAPRLGVTALVLFLVPVTFTMHAFWREEGISRALDAVTFTKNLALLGAALMFTAIPEPWPHGVSPHGHLAGHAKVG